MTSLSKTSWQIPKRGSFSTLFFFGSISMHSVKSVQKYILPCRRNPLAFVVYWCCFWKLWWSTFDGTGLHRTYSTCSSECHLSVWVTAYRCPRVDVGRWGGDHNLWCYVCVHAKVGKKSVASTKCCISLSCGRFQRFWGDYTTLSSTCLQTLGLLFALMMAFKFLFAI